MKKRKNVMKMKKIKKQIISKNTKYYSKTSIKKKIDLASTKEKKEIYKSIAKNSHSITSKDEIKKTVNHNHSKNNNKNKR